MSKQFVLAQLERLMQLLEVQHHLQHHLVERLVHIPLLIERE
jgi:hypothetical protein